MSSRRWRGRLLGHANFAFAGVLALVMALATVLVASINNLPIRDPDGVVVPMYAQLPIILLLAWLVDVLPRALFRARGLRRLPELFGQVARERWDRSHLVFALSGLGTWYVCYAAFRNLKSYVPFIHGALYDRTLERIDDHVWFGHDPATVLHDIFGTGIAAHFFSFIYVAWIVLIPVTLAIALMWTRAPAAGSWFVTTIAVDWFLGVAAYFALPTLGPVYSAPEDFRGLPHTYTTTLEEALLRDRQDVLANPHSTHAVQTIAAFPSLHVGLMISVALLVGLIGLRRWLRVASWIFFVLTVLGTIYLGWHFFTDAVGGAILGSLAVWIAALGTGNHIGWRPRLVQRGAYELHHDVAPSVPDRTAVSRPA